MEYAHNDPAKLSPVEAVGDIFVKRDDYFEIAGVNGGKARACWALAQGAKGLVTASSRFSPQVCIVAHIAKYLGIPCHIHTASGASTPEIVDAERQGAVVVCHRPGYNTVIIHRAEDDARQLGWTYIPFGMECEQAVEGTCRQVKLLPIGIGRIVVPVGSGMTLAGILQGLDNERLNIPVLGVMVGASPYRRLALYAPLGWQSRGVTLVKSPLGYHQQAPHEWCNWRMLSLDPIYEAKCVPFLQRGDLFWIVGNRALSKLKQGEATSSATGSI